MRRGKAIGWTLVLGLVAWALAGRGLVNYDTLYALVWGRDLDARDAPRLRRLARPHAAPAGHAGRRGPLAPRRARASIDAHHRPRLRLPRRARLGHLPPRRGVDQPRGRRAGGGDRPHAPPGARLRRPRLRRRPVPRARPRRAARRDAAAARAGAPVLALLGVAGLIRPEAWLFSGAYLVWLWVGGVRDPRLWALAAAAPLLWALGDLIVTGDPLHSLTGTRDTAQRLQRITGLDEVPGTVPRRLGEILREPVLFGAAGGGLLALAFLRTRVALGAVGRRRRDRRLLRARRRRPADPRALPARARRRSSPSSAAPAPSAGPSSRAAHPWRRPWAWFGALTLVGLVAFIPPQVDRIGDLRDALRIQDGIQDDLHALDAALSRCTPVTVPNHRPVPLLALWLDVDPHADRGRPGAAAAQRHLRRAGEPRASRASTSSTRATSTRASRRRRRASGPSGPNALVARLRALRMKSGPCTLLRSRSTERLRLERLRHRALPLRTSGSA